MAQVVVRGLGEDGPLIMQLRRAAEAIGGIDIDDYLPDRAELPRNAFASGG